MLTYGLGHPSNYPRVLANMMLMSLHIDHYPEMDYDEMVEAVLRDCDARFEEVVK